MKKTLVVLIIASSGLLCNRAKAQKKDFALIEKNVNITASDLFHDLNKTKDTLVLNGDKRIRNVYSINTNYKRETQELIDANSAKVPLTHLSKGKHIFVVEQVPLKIVFVVRVLQDRKEFSKVEVEKITASNNKK
ncbi:hypothetical protein [Pontimicrobium sp. SW4]|uniref:DUF4138 domain-containing protein n=1 Tax=Pontimicrobium sp. SW4 TaxID=3153519 RepID=A0AAU7BQ02_9FLAO